MSPPDVASDGLSLLAAAREAPERLALIADERELTFAELGEHVAAAVGWLVERARQPADLASATEAGSGTVAVVARPTLETVAVLYALFELGWPTLLVRPRLPARERASLLGALSPALVVDEDSARAALRHPPGEPALLRTRDHPGERALAIIPTSGSAGRPKCAVLSRRAFLASAEASASNLGWEEDDRWLLALPLAHVGGLSILVRTLLARRCAVLASPGSFDPLATAATMASHRVTLASFVPAMLDRLLDAEPAWNPESCLRAVLLGGAPASRRLLERAADRGVPVLTTYGLTESCSQVTTQPYGTVNRGELGCGPPLPGVELRIEDGEIRLRGPALFSGYVGLDADGPAPDEEGWLATGDSGWLDAAGNLHVGGRLDDRLITGGENVDPRAVEAVIEEIEGVGEACVFGVDDDTWGTLLAVAIVPSGELTESELRTRFGETLAPYRRPRLFATLDALPRNPTGKLDRAAAARAAEERLKPI